MHEWAEEEFSTPGKLTALVEQSREAFPSLDINQDVEWLHTLCDKPGKSVLVLTAREGRKLIGLAPVEVHPTHLKFSIGDLTIAKKKVQRFAIEREPLVAARDVHGALAECYRTLARLMPDNAAVFLRGVPDASPTHDLLRRAQSPLKSVFCVAQHGRRYRRCRIRWNGSFEDYLASLGAVTRKDLRRTLKKAETRYNSDLRLLRFSQPDDVAQFVRLATQVTAQTYQNKLGVSVNEKDKPHIITAARKGRFRGHVMLFRSAPVAYHLGYVYRGRFYMIDGGYDPKWSKAQMGILTFLRMLLDFEQQREPVTLLDYLYGEDLYKLRTSNDTRFERHYYLFKRTPSGAALATAMLATGGLSRGLGTALDRLGAKSALKRAVRRLA